MIQGQEDKAKDETEQQSTSSSVPETSSEFRSRTPIPEDPTESRRSSDVLSSHIPTPVPHPSRATSPSEVTPSPIPETISRVASPTQQTGLRVASPVPASISRAASPTQATSSRIASPEPVVSRSASPKPGTSKQTDDDKPSESKEDEAKPEPIFKPLVSDKGKSKVYGKNIGGWI